MVWSGAEWRRAATHPAGQRIWTQDMQLNCPYITQDGVGRCAIYSERPILCRLFGATEEESLKCPHGCKPPHPLTVGQTKRIMRQYKKLVL